MSVHLSLSLSLCLSGAHEKLINKLIWDDDPGPPGKKLTFNDFQEWEDLGIVESDMSLASEIKEYLTSAYMDIFSRVSALFLIFV